MTDARRIRRPRRLAVVALALVLLGVLAGLGAAAGSGAGLWSFRPAFTALRWAFFAAAAGGVLALVALVWALLARAGTVAVSVVALVLAGGFCGTVAGWAGKADHVPPIHDVSTDLADPPQFAALPLRADNLETVPDGDEAALAALSPIERLHTLQRRAYPDLKTVTLPLSSENALTAVENLVRSRGWEVAAVDRAAGTIEATDTVSLFRFRDDVVVRVRPAPGGSAVNVRSVSRVGVSDLGVNAKRVRGFLKDLRAAAGTGSYRTP